MRSLMGSWLPEGVARRGGVGGEVDVAGVGEREAGNAARGRPALPLWSGRCSRGRGPKGRGPGDPGSGLGDKRLHSGSIYPHFRRVRTNTGRDLGDGEREGAGSLVPGLRVKLGRGGLLAAGMAALVAGIYGGLLRLPVALPVSAVQAWWLVWHGPLMVCGFLGTLIGIERAVGLRAGWPWLAPVLTASGVAGLVTGQGLGWAPWAMVAGSVCFVAVSIRIQRLQPVLSNAVMTAGALAWVAGNVRWAGGGAVSQVVLWWVVFLLLTITGERIQLTRYRKPSKLARPALHVALAVLAAGLAAGREGTGWAPRAGGVLAGAGLAGLAGWLATFDIARVTIRHAGLPRFMAACLLGGYGWLAVAAVLIALDWPLAAGYRYDATLHAFFVGFVFSMIFGHAPVIFPAVLGLGVRFHPVMYVPVAVMHVSLILRVTGDLATWAWARSWGGTGNAVATVLFLVLTAGSILSAKLPGTGVR